MLENSSPGCKACVTLRRKVDTGLPLRDLEMRVGAIAYLRVGDGTTSVGAIAYLTVKGWHNKTEK